MSEYDNIVVGKLKLKGKATDVKVVGLKKKKKQKKVQYERIAEIKESELSTGCHCRLAKTSNKAHRDRIQDFNQYLANMSEHYDIPKVGPG
ncbi:hypothetical protein MKX01_008222 [Papaver californicum]|nr:hypothetical protein MKX01_008222 [Papaver californicum]